MEYGSRWTYQNNILGVGSAVDGSLFIVTTIVCVWRGGCSRFCSYAVLTMYKMQNFLVLRKNIWLLCFFLKFLIAMLLLVLVLFCFFHDCALGRSPVCLLDLLSAYEWQDLSFIFPKVKRNRSSLRSLGYCQIRPASYVTWGDGWGVCDKIVRVKKYFSASAWQTYTNVSS